MALSNLASSDSLNASQFFLSQGLCEMKWRHASPLLGRWRREVCVYVCTQLTESCVTKTCLCDLVDSAPPFFFSLSEAWFPFSQGSATVWALECVKWDINFSPQWSVSSAKLFLVHFQDIWGCVSLSRSVLSTLTGRSSLGKGRIFPVSVHRETLKFEMLPNETSVVLSLYFAFLLHYIS